MADVIRLPTAAAQPVVNPKRKGTPPVNVTRKMDMVYRRRRREESRLRQAAKAREATERWESLATSLARDVRAVIKEARRQTKPAEQVDGGRNV